MPRSILDEAHIHPAIREAIASNHADIVAEVQAAIAAHDVVVVGMAQNPVPKQPSGCWTRPASRTST
jgi:hypothetical protein